MNAVLRAHNWGWRTCDLITDVSARRASSGPRTGTPCRLIPEKTGGASTAAAGCGARHERAGAERSPCPEASRAAAHRLIRRTRSEPIRQTTAVDVLRWRAVNRSTAMGRWLCCCRAVHGPRTRTGPGGWRGRGIWRCGGGIGTGTSPRDATTDKDRTRPTRCPPLFRGYVGNKRSVRTLRTVDAFTHGFLIIELHGASDCPAWRGCWNEPAGKRGKPILIPSDNGSEPRASPPWPFPERQIRLMQVRSSPSAGGSQIAAFAAGCLKGADCARVRDAGRRGSGHQ